MIPKLRKNGTLPPGRHPASWNEVKSRFGHGSVRQRLLVGLEAMCRHLKSAGATRVWLDGSFVTAKPEPGDFDLCFPMSEIDESKVEACIIGMDSLGMKEKYGGEAMLDQWPSVIAGKSIMDFFQLIKGTYTPKGIVELDLGTLP